jgi:3-oxoacyl-[acyl-carrier-protein] synthase II
VRGANVTLNNKEASSLAAVACAGSLLRSGAARAVVSGGVDDVEAVFLTAHETFGVLAHDAGHGEASRPFDRRRNGFVLGAGGFLVICETAASAADRGAAAIGSLLAVAGTSMPCRLNDWPERPESIADCMREALRQAHATPNDVALVIASANSTTALDKVEADAIADVCGTRTVPVASLKGALGESGASGAAGLIVALAALRDGRLPPTVGCDDPDPECPVDVSNASRAIATRPGAVAIVNSIASGGTMYSAVVRA